ncbi:MAG TPA: RNA polymerase sigma factor [Fibrobacteria bacterium]|nr:RNA polymerase sigma factor [Fibrobacteria bacterium]
MEAAAERPAGTEVAVKVVKSPPDPMQEINSPFFLKALLGGAPAASRAFRKLVRALHPPLSRYVGRYLRDPELVQDVLQETFLAAHRALPRFEAKSKLTTWVYSLTYHKVCDRLSEKYQPGFPVPEAEAQGREWESPAPLADEALHQSRLIRWIGEAAEEIPALYREAYRLRDLEGLSGEEAAEALGISPTLIRVRLHRARCLIVERLRRKFPGAFAEGISL